MTTQQSPGDLIDQRIAERRVLFGGVEAAFAALCLEGPIALLGTARSLAALSDDAFGGALVHRFDGVRQHNPREVVDAAGAFADAHGARSVVAIGSSSAIDLGQAVADGRDVVLALVPSALGGAEMSRGYGVLEGDRKTGGRLRSPAPDAVASVAHAFAIPDLAAEAEAIAAAFELPRTFAELGAPADLVARALPRVMEQPLLPNNPAPPDEATVEALLHGCLFYTSD